MAESEWLIRSKGFLVDLVEVVKRGAQLALRMPQMS